MFSRSLFFKKSTILFNLYKNSQFQSIVRNMSNDNVWNLNAVLKQLEKFAPLKLAESWDNVGVLIESTEDSNKSLIKTVLLTIDLTELVVQEAIDEKAELIITYHPIIFKPLKSLTQRSWKDRIAIKCIKNNINVFSPHTTWDAIDNGVNDWLASVFPRIRKTVALIPSADYNNVKVGMGRLINMETSLKLDEIITRIKTHIGINHLRLGLAKNGTLNSEISSVAICAGSGASVLNGVNADLYLTGEMLHHDVLDATQKGIHVILCNHSDSERGYLKTFQQAFVSHVPGVNILISKFDKDCLTTV